MYYKIIACEVLKREIEYVSASLMHQYDITYLKQEYHNTPVDLQINLQQAIDNCTDSYDAILLGYGLCSNGVVDIHSEKYPIIIPKAHDCISLFLGCKDRYKEYFDSHHGGIYWYNAGWIDQTVMPSRSRYKMLYDKYAEQYGEDNAQYLMELEQGWFTEYTHCTFISWPEFDDTTYKTYTKECAEFLSWEYDELVGSKSLLVALLNGVVSPDTLLTIPPKNKIAASFDNDILYYK